MTPPNPRPEQVPTSPTGVVPATASRTVLAVGPSVAALAEPCLAVAREGMLLAFAYCDADADAAWRLAARLASQGAVALPLRQESVGSTLEANEGASPGSVGVSPVDSPPPYPIPSPVCNALVERVIEDFGRLDGVLAVAEGGVASPDSATIGDLLRAASRRLGRGEPRVAGRFVVVWRGEADGLEPLLAGLAARAADAALPGRGRFWDLHGMAWPAGFGAGDAAVEGVAAQKLAGWLAPIHTAPSVPGGAGGAGCGRIGDFSGDFC